MFRMVPSRSIAFIALALVLVFVVGCGGGTATGPKEITLGLTAPMTGDYAEYGTVFKNAAELAIEKINAQGGVNGQKLKLVVGDSKADPKEAANIAQKFVSDSGIIGVIGDFTSTAALAGAPIYQKGGLVQLSPTSSHPDFTKQGTYMFRNIATQEVEGAILAEYAVNKLKKNKIAIVYINNDWGIVAHGNFMKKAKALGAEILTVEPYLPEQGKDFSAIVTKVRAANPDMVYLGMMYTDAALFAQQARKAGLTAPLIGTGSLYSDELIKLGGSAVDGLYLTCSFYPNDPRPEVQDFVKSYQAKYGKLPTMFAAQAFDATNLVIQALKNGATDRKSLRDKLAEIKDFPGVTGKTSFDENRDVNKGLAELVVKDGKYVPYQPGM
ncbi:MAG: ABC transporter substrate-binding protein [Negativicutes bacterium]|nr:ABC transporter substrate-binding protein [Negativicutes bacterium]